MDPLEQLVIAVVAALAQAIAHEAVPLIVAALAAPSTAQEGFADEDLQSRLRAAIDRPPAVVR